MKFQDLYYLARKIVKGGHLQIVNNGYKEAKEKITDYIYGSATPFKDEIICPSGDWTPFLPPPERQSGRKMESMSCTSFGVLNAIETIIFAKYRIRVNYSDRFLAKCSGTTKSGNNIDNVIDTLRKVSGVVSEEKWPTDWENFTWEDYFSEIPKIVLDDGRLWVDEWEIGRENVPNNKELRLRAFKKSPPIVSGYAWYMENGLYRSYGKANHCYMLSKPEMAFDSYPPFDKPLAPDYLFGAFKILSVNMLKPQDIEIKKLLLRGFKYIMRTDNKGQIYKISNGILEEIPIENIIESLKIDGQKGTDFNLAVTEVVKAMFANKMMCPVPEELFIKLQ
jgi:hypothetical protein